MKGRLHSGVEAESFESWYSWFLSFLPRWFMIPPSIFFYIHDSRRLYITYWLNDFLSGNLVSFCSVSLAFKLLFHPDSVYIIIRFVQVWRFCNCIKHQIAVETSRLSAPNACVIQGGPGACSHRKMFENGTHGNAISCIHWIERN